MVDLDKLDALCESATSGPWETWDLRGVQCTKPKVMIFDHGWQVTETENVGEPLGDTHQGVRIGGRNATGTGWPDSQFIAAARQAVPELVAEVRELRRHTAKLESALDEVTREADDA